MEKNTAEDRREFKRVGHREPVWYQFNDSQQFGGSLSRDISEGGVQLNLNKFVPLNAGVELRMKMDNGKVIDRIGRVMWVEKYPFVDRYRVGLKFKEQIKLKSSLR